VTSGCNEQQAGRRATEMGPRRRRTGGPRRAAGGRSGQADGAGRCRRGTDGEAATGGARGALSAARAREATGGRATGQKKRISGGCGGDSPHPNPTYSDSMLPWMKMAKDTEERGLDVYMYREEYGPWA